MAEGTPLLKHKDEGSTSASLDDVAALAPSSSSSSWAIRLASKPVNMLIFFSLASTLLYMDRGAFASEGVNGSLDTRSCIPESDCVLLNNTCVARNDTVTAKCTMEGSPSHGFQGEFGLSGELDGWLQSMFLIGLLVASPIFAYAAKTRDNLNLCGVGLLLWSIAVFLNGMCFDFYTMALCRTFVGIGEAALITIVPHFIDTCAPPAQKAKWLATYCIAIPTGTAMGYVYGGLVSSTLGWRYAFFISGIIMIPMMIFPLLVPTESLAYWNKHDPNIASPGGAEGAARAGVLGLVGLFMKDVRTVVSNEVYLLGGVGYCLYSAQMGVLAYWGPKSGQAIFDDVKKYGSADSVFGIMIIVSGIVGTFLGGYLLDRVGVSIAKSLVLCALMTLSGVIVLIFSVLAWTTVEPFLLTMTVGLILIFAIQGPINIVPLWSTPYLLRPFACALYTVSIHVFGDVPSAPIAGKYHDSLFNRYREGGDSKAVADAKAWRVTLVLSCMVGSLSVIFWILGWFFQKRRDGRRFRDERERGSLEE